MTENAAMLLALLCLLLVSDSFSSRSIAKGPVRRRATRLANTVLLHPIRNLHLTPPYLF